MSRHSTVRGHRDGSGQGALLWWGGFAALATGVALALFGVPWTWGVSVVALVLVVFGTAWVAAVSQPPVRSPEPAERRDDPVGRNA